MPHNFTVQNLIEVKDKEKRAVCGEHPDKRLKLYCFKCTKIICVKCIDVPHQEHKCATVETISKKIAEQIQSDIEPFSSRISQFRESLSKVEVANKKFLQTIEEMKHGLRQRGDEIKNLVDDHVAKLTKELNEVKERSVKEAEARVESIKLALAALESFQTHSMEIASKCSPSDITRSFNELHTRAEELLKSHVITGDYCPPVVQFEPTEKLIKGGLHNIVGGLAIHCAMAVAQCIVSGPVCLWVCVGASVTTITRNCMHRS